MVLYCILNKIPTPLHLSNFELELSNFYFFDFSMVKTTIPNSRPIIVTIHAVPSTYKQSISKRSKNHISSMELDLI